LSDVDIHQLDTHDALKRIRTNQMRNVTSAKKSKDPKDEEVSIALFTPRKCHSHLHTAACSRARNSGPARNRPCRSGRLSSTPFRREHVIQRSSLSPVRSRGIFSVKRIFQPIRAL